MAMPSNNKNDAIGPLFVLFAERKKRRAWVGVDNGGLMFGMLSICVNALLVHKESQLKFAW